MRGPIPVCLMALLLLSGCSSSGGDPSTTTTSSAGVTGSLVTTSPVPSTGTGGPTTSNRPPTGTLAASAPGGDVPFTVTFTMDANDADNDPLAWSLDVDGDGTADTRKAAPAAFPATFNHTYTAPGRFNVTYTIDDGGSTVSYGLVLNVTGTLASQSVTGGWPASSAGCGGPYESWAFGTPATGVAWHEFAVDAATIGRPYTVDFESDALAEVVSVDFYTADGLSRVGGMFDTAPFSDVVPDGAVLGLVSDCAAVNLTFTYQTS